MEPRFKTAFALGLVEGILLILFGVCVTFDRPVQPRHATAAEEKYNEATFNRLYPSELSHILKLKRVSMRERRSYFFIGTL